jgi:type II restriction enzyme
MIRSIANFTVPTFLFLHYHPLEWTVQDLFFVPRHFLSPSLIEKRPPLRPTAERAGWVGCNILLAALPRDARIDAVRNGVGYPANAVREAWRAFSFLRDATPESRGWMADVLACVREIRKPEFTLNDVYAFERRLGNLHKDNRNVRPKIRQQLQVLRDRGVLEFLGRGRYRVLLAPQTG